MVYITVKQSPMYHQLSIEDLLLGDFRGSALISANTSNTRTYAVERVSAKFMSRLDILKLIRKLESFNAATASLREIPRKDLYHSFSIPKRHGGLRHINAPNPDLMSALRLLKTIFEQDFCALYHTNAFAYVQGRCTLDAIKRHQANESRWFAKLDLHDFFGSTTPEFVMKMFSMVFPFSEIVRYPQGKAALETALDLAFLDGGLPQGTPISPTITNVMMIPIDYQLSKRFRDFNGQKLIYTRYADDFTISSRNTFSVGDVERAVMDTLRKYDAKFTLNQSKTRYGSSSGRNWNLGLMMQTIQNDLRCLDEMGVPREDSANGLPLGMTTTVVCKHNLRNLMDMSHQRMCGRAYHEFRQLFTDVCNALRAYGKEWEYIVDHYFMPKCEYRGVCPEKFSCGHRPRKETQA